MVQALQNWRLTAWFVAIVAVLAWAVALLLVRILAPSDLVPAAKYLGVATVAGVLAALFLNNCLWRLSFIRGLLKIPDLSGRWEGWQFRTLEKEWRPTAHEITPQPSHRILKKSVGLTF